MLLRQLPPSAFHPAWNAKTDSLIRVNKHWSSVYVYLPSVVSDVGVKETFAPHDVQFAAEVCLQLSAFLFEECLFLYFFTILYLLFETLSLSNKGTMYRPCFQPKKVLEIRTRDAEILLSLCDVLPAAWFVGSVTAVNFPCYQKPS